jgi:hypothetical protein
MPCLLALAVLAAAGFDQLAAWARFRHAFTAVAAALIGYLGITLIRVHPYYLDYFGEHTGGAGHVAEHRVLETAWWGEGLDRAVDYVNEHAARGAAVSRQCVAPSHLAWFRDDLWQSMASAADKATWIVAYAPQTLSCKLPPDARPVFSVTAGGAVLATVYQRR